MMNKEIVQLLHSVFIVFFCLHFRGFCLETDTITTSLLLRDSDTIVSRGGVFKLGFFTPNNTTTTNRYLGIFYTVSSKTVIWVANRDKPLKDSSGIVTIATDGNLVLINGSNETVWSTDVTGIRNNNVNTTAQITNAGNLILHDASTGSVLWQSFLHPSSVFVPTLRLIDNINTGEKVVLSAWRNESDPELGNFTVGLDALNTNQIVTWNNHGRPYWRTGPWNGQILLGVRDMYTPYLDGFSVKNDNDSPGSFYFTAPEGSVLTRFTLNPTGDLVETLWNDQTRSWDVTWSSIQSECDFYGKCGPFGSCNSKASPICSCLRGFEPVDIKEWERGNWSGGCARKKELQCENVDGFYKLRFMKVPDFAEQFQAWRMDECRTRCLSNCSCIGYAHDPYLGCLFWSKSMVDIQRFDGVGVDLYIRLESSELDINDDKRLFITIPVIVGFMAITLGIFIAWCWIDKRKGNISKDRKVFDQAGPVSPDSTAIILIDETREVNMGDLSLFTFERIANATDQFHDKKLLGRGGFGPVYKGTLANGKEIAVKRLSAASRQGYEEFINEVVVISRVQHRNLVRLLGCCAEREEKILIYEYMPNKSLDRCLFEPIHPSQKIQDWKKRFSIIEGIGRGLMYLHKDSRLKIIHRDLKPSNILLDEDWNPRISDFGMARIFEGNEDHRDTARVVGTYGYMAPEYAMEGRFSEKSDVYSFGVLMLEIISGKKNTSYYNQELSLSLSGYAWKLWSEDNGLAFVDQTIASLDFEEDIIRCIDIALLCIQKCPKDRPAIQTALSMLSREIVDLPMPEQPVISIEKWNHLHADGAAEQPTSQVVYSINELTITVLDGR